MADAGADGLGVALSLGDGKADGGGDEHAPITVIRTSQWISRTD